MARRRYVPKTYNNRRVLRIIAMGIITLALSFFILFLLLFFWFQRYVVDGQLMLPWQIDEPAAIDEGDSDAGDDNGIETEDDFTGGIPGED